MKSLAFARTGLVFSSLALSAGIAWSVWPKPRVDPSKPTTWVTPNYVRHSGYYTFEPNTRLERINERHERIVISIDEHGLRNPPGALPSSRVLVLGDSFVNALASRDDQTFTAVLSKILDKPVYNAGVHGYSTFQVTRLMRDLLKKGANSETVVLVFFLGNDFRDNYMDWARQSEVGWMASYGVSQLLSYRKTPTDQFQKAFRKTGEALDQLKALCADQGRRLVVVGVPARARYFSPLKNIRVGRALNFTSLNGKRSIRNFRSTDPTGVSPTCSTSVTWNTSRCSRAFAPTPVRGCTTIRIRIGLVADRI